MKPKKPKKVLIDLKTVQIRVHDERNCAVYVLKGTKWKRQGFYTSIIQALRAIQTKELLINPNEVYDFMSYMQGIERSNAQLREVMNKHDTVQLQSCKSV